MDDQIIARLEETKNNPIERYREYGYYQFSDWGGGINLRESREYLFYADKNEDDDVKEIDQIVIEAAQANDYVERYLLEDNNQKPLADWWWHLGKIRNKTYPADLLPDHLRSIYSESSDGQVAA